MFTITEDFFYGRGEQIFVNLLRGPPPPTPTEILNTPLWIQIDMVGPGSEPLLATGFTFCEEDWKPVENILYTYLYKVKNPNGEKIRVKNYLLWIYSFLIKNLCNWFRQGLQEK